jgi:undecaprenyl diphosphate synthase
MKSLKEEIDLRNLPRHIAIIMDGNGRWAKEQGHDRLWRAPPSWALNT